MNCERVYVLFTLCFFCLCNISYNHIIIDQGVPPSDIDIIIQKHNHLRKLIADGKVPGQPRGSNLKLMKWDEKLATEAQCIANSCNYTHFRVKDSRWLVGQNLHRKRSTRLTNDTLWDSAIQHWFDEYKMYQYGNRGIKGTGHYTQMIWATTEFIGCGYCSYETDEPLKYHKLYVCNYGPRGNYIGMVPYIVTRESCDDLHLI